MSENESSNDVGEKIEKRSCRSEDVRLTLKILASHKYFCAKRILGRGTYGDVFMMYDPAKNSNVAVKIITSENIAKIELEMWPKLRHPNIVSVLEVMTLQPLDVAIFVMPVQRKSLHDILYEKRFLCRNDSLDYLKVWLFQTLCALDYLDSRELCHLDIKVDNVLISNEYTAKLCDFSFLNFNSKCLERYDLGLPYIYRPPEACHCLGNNISIDGRAYDMWGFGIMVVEIFTHFVLATNVPDCKNWIKEVYPTLFGILQEKEFSNLMIQTFPGYNMSQTQTKLALNFAHSFLMLEPSERSVALEASQHRFLNRGMYLVPLSDPLWTHEVYSESVKLPSVKSWIKKSPHSDDGKIDESEDRKELDEPSPTTDDEYLTTSDSEDEIKHSNSINEFMNTLSEKDHSSDESSEMEQSNSNESLIESNFLQKNTEFDFSQMGDVSAIKKDEKNLWLKSKHKISVLSNDVEQYGDENASKKYSISMSASKTIPRKLKKKHMLNKKSRLHHNPMKSKILCLSSEVYMSGCSNRPLKNIPKSEHFLRKLLEQKVIRAGSDGKKTFYKLSKKKTISYTENNRDSSDLSSLSSGSLFFGFSEINIEAESLKTNKSIKNVEAVEPVTENSAFENASKNPQFNEKCSKGATGDTYFSDHGDLVDFDCTDNLSTTCNGIYSLNPEFTISRDEESDQSDEINDASHIMASVKKTLGQLNQINDILQKVLICENCNSKRKMVEEGKAENIHVTEIKPDCIPFEFLEDSREIDNDHVDDATNMRTAINAGCHEINCKNSILPLDRENSQNVNLIINCPAIQKGVHQQETSNGGKPEGSPENSYHVVCANP